MASDATLPVQAAIVAALKADAGVGAVVGDRIYDRAPEGVAFPYVSIGAETGSPWEGSTLSGWEMVLQIDIWSRKPGAVEARQAMAAVSAALHRAEMTIAGNAFVLCNLESQRTMGDPDGVTTHGVQLYRIITHS